MAVLTPEIRTNADFQQYNFFRTPDWRWERILYLTDRPGETPGRCTRRDDNIIRTAKAFVCRRRSADVQMLERLKFENPGLFFAYEFHQRIQDDPEAAYFIEARVLARQSTKQIAELMGLLPEAVQWYCDLFFDVLPHLDKRDWITKHVIIPAITKSTVGKKQEIDMAQGAVPFKDSTVARPFMDGTLKLFAYYGGANAVDIMIGGLPVGKPMASPDDAAEWFGNVIDTTVRRRAAQAATVCDVNKYNVMELLAVHTRLLEIAKSADNVDQARTLIEKHVRTTIEDIPWVVGSDGEKAYDGSVVGRLDSMAGELRDDELLLVASGKPAPALADEYPMALPPVRKEKRAALTQTDEL